MPEELPQPAAAETRKLAAIMFTDLVGFSRQMGANEARTLRILAVHNQVIEHAVAVHQGHVIKTAGDGFLVEFPSVVHAVQCAQHIQAQFRTHNAEKGEPIHVRIGIHLGDILVQSTGDVLGDGVNIASRLQAFAEPDTICISDMVHRDVAQKVPLGTVVSLGRPRLKNIAQRFPVYALLSEPPQGLRQTLRIQRLKLARRVGSAHRAAAVVLLLALASVGTLMIKNVYFPTPSPGQPQGVAPTGSQAALPLPDKPSIVVLPFDNMSKDPEQDYFSNGITEVLTSDLSRISSLFVIARNTAFTYKGKAANVQEVGKELGVRYVLEGSVQKANDQVRIVAQLVDTTTGGHLWSERYDRPLKDIFALQDEIVQKIVTTLKLQLSLWEQGSLVRKRTDSQDAYDYYLRGMEYRWRVTKEAMAQARQMFEKAIALDPQYAEAYAILGWIHYLEWFGRWSPDPPQSLEQAFILAQKAIALDDSLPAAHTTLSIIYAWKQQPDRALAEAERATTLDPNNAASYATQADVFTIVGRPEAALRSIEQAMRLNPHYPYTYSLTLGVTYCLLGRYEEAIATLKQTLTRNPNHPIPYSFLAYSYLAQWWFQLSPDPQTLEQAVAMAQRHIALSDQPSVRALLGYGYLWQKQYEQAIVEMEQAIPLRPNLSRGHAGLAEVLGYMGRTKESLEWVEKAVQIGAPVTVAWHFHSLGTAYYLAGRYEEAIAYLKKAIDYLPTNLIAHLYLAVVYSELSKGAEAQAEAAEVLRINPQFSLEVHKQRVPIEDPAMLERHIAALRKAGLK